MVVKKAKKSPMKMMENSRADKTADKKEMKASKKKK